jgi:hypothetical protein
MAKHVPALVKLNRTRESDVGVGLESTGRKPKISREIFWVSKSQGDCVQWFCNREEVEKHHVHGEDSPCFTVIFDKNGSPFESRDFTSDKNGYACSDRITAEPDESRIYHYRVVMKDKEPLDPSGGVRP